MGFLFGLLIFCTVAWFWIRGNAFVAFVLAVCMVFFASPWRLWIYPNQPDQDGLVAYLEQFLAALAVAYVPWMVRGIIRSVRAAPLQCRQPVQVPRARIRT